MKIVINDKKQKEIFISIFQLIKNCSSHINLNFNINFLHIQGMDKSHICLYEIKINKNWFSSYYIKENTKLSFDSSVFYSIISSKSDNQELIIELSYINNKICDFLDIHFINQINNNKKDFKKSFKIPLIDFDYDELKIPIVDYDTEFCLSSKQIHDTLSELTNFGNEILIHCTESKINLSTNGDIGEMNVEIPIDDLNSYSIIEDEEIKLTYSLLYLHKMCISNKLSNHIEFYLSKEYPMKINYNLGEESSLTFFIAPKIID
jgi:proliferating cell nuclear antigen